MSFAARRIVGLISVAAAGLFIAAAGTSAASAATWTSMKTGSGSTGVSTSTVQHRPAPFDARPYGPETGGISPITGYQQSGYTQESIWVDANQDSIFPYCPGSVAPLGPQQNLATVTGDMIQSNQGHQVTDTLETTNDAYGCR